MTKQEAMKELTPIFRELFDDDSIVLTDSMTAADVEGWDSLIHITLMDAVEEEFEIRFDMKTVVKMKNVGELADAIEKLL